MFGDGWDGEGCGGVGWDSGEQCHCDLCFLLLFFFLD